MTRRRRGTVGLSAVVAGTLLAGALAGCGAVSPPPAAPTDQEETTMTPETVTSAVAASDPRIAEVLTVQVVQSGLARVMTIAVAISGDEPVTTETVLNIAIAALENAKSDIDELKLIARPAGDTSQLLDLSAAAAGIPADVDHRWSGTSLQFIAPDLAALTAAR